MDSSQIALDSFHDIKKDTVAPNLSVTVAMISYQDELLIEECLRSIRGQSYEQKLVDILLVDGGSKDRTVEIAKSYGARVISRPDLREQPMLRVALAFLTPSTDLVMIFSADNRFQESDGLARMIDPFYGSDISGSSTLRYGLRKDDPALSRYFALIGGNDPIAVALGRADRGPHDMRAWHSYGEVEDRGEWYEVKFCGQTRGVPTLGGNGFIFKRQEIEKSQYAKSGVHIDLCLDLIRNGHSRFSFIKDRHIIHLIHVPLLQFLRRRLFYAHIYSGDFVPRIYSVFQILDIRRVTYIIFASATLVLPILRALRGYLVVRDPAWFLHPVILLVFTIGYSLHYLRKIVLRAFCRSHQTGRRGH